MAFNGSGLGEQIRQTDEYGNPLPHSGITTGAHGTHAGAASDGYGTHTGATTGADGTHTGEHEKKEHGHGGILHRSNSSSSSSSSEDDGQGGRRKKLKDRIKDKMPGRKKDDGQTTTTETPTPGAQGAYVQEAEHPEKKGFMEKIKEKLPGHH